MKNKQGICPSCYGDNGEEAHIDALCAICEKQWKPKK